ncbi:MAG: SMC-Scp complex subunit ScpB [Candidatus Marsarchaeota archaeon]|nr:SMC-Scp complex subunit ScpB [Candidatus Marsarchaeota archaeon]MCL5094366.1 SMC-Scp complex subunit ScpB [Candidatus Marsarchaeota archaeon]
MENELDYKKIIEAALFVSNKALSIQDLSGSLNIKSISAIKQMVQELIEDYKNRDTSLQILEINNKYLLTLKSQYMSKVNNLAGSPDISKSSLRILAYISKNEPILQSKLVKIFGTSTYVYIKELLEKEFVMSAKFKNSKNIRTTQKFKEYFSFNNK